MPALRTFERGLGELAQGETVPSYGKDGDGWLEKRRGQGPEFKAELPQLGKGGARGYTSEDKEKKGSWGGVLMGKRGEKEG